MHYDNYNLHCVISIHALLAESDRMFASLFCGVFLFLSTLSLRRATLETICCWRCNGYFYPRSPCGERPWQRGSRVTYVEFLSTLSLRRATPLLAYYQGHIKNFYPRSPCGERHTWARGSRVTYVISIHALLAESDRPKYPIECRWQNISIHALLAESDHEIVKFSVSSNVFLSTLSLRRATQCRL